MGYGVIHGYWVHRGYMGPIKAGQEFHHGYGIHHGMGREVLCI